MALLPNWRAVVKCAWSIRLIILAGFLSGIEVALPFIDMLGFIPPGIFAALSGITTMLAFIARITAQKGLTYED